MPDVRRHGVAMKSFHIVMIAALFVAAGLSPTTRGQSSVPAKEIQNEKRKSGRNKDKKSGSKRLTGSAMYARYCALCHGADREGYAADEAPSLRSPELIGAATGGYLITAISHGRPGTAMSAFEDTQGGPLSHKAIHTLVDWLIFQAKVDREPVPDEVIIGDASNGGKLYANYCANCHGTQGEGGRGTSLANRVFLASASDAFIRYSIAKGRTGTPMPSFQGKLTDAEINDVVSFVRSRAVGWEAQELALAPPPSPENAILNPNASPAQLEHRAGRFVSADSVEAAMRRGEKIVLLDARPFSDWQSSHIPGALPMPFYDGVESLVPHLPNDGTPIVAYCACPHAASGRVVDQLTKAGFTSARILDEGVLVWAARGYPVAVGASPE